MTELAAAGIPVTVTCRVWWRRIARTRSSTRTATTPSSGTDSSPTKPAMRARRWRTERRGGSRRPMAGSVRSASPSGARDAGPAPGPRRPLRRHRRERPDPACVRSERAQRAVVNRHHGAQDRRGQALPLRGQGRLFRPHRRLLDRLADEVPAGRPGTRERRRNARRRHGLRGPFRQRISVPQPQDAPRPGPPPHGRVHGESRLQRRQRRDGDAPIGVKRARGCFRGVGRGVSRSTA